MDLFLDILATASQDPSNVNKTTYDNKTANQKRPSSSPLQLVRQHQLVEFALGGICNCIPDFPLQQQFIEGDGVEILVPFILEIPLEGDRSTALTPSELNVIVSSLSIAFFLLDSSAFTAITSDQLIAKMRQCQQNSIVQVSNTAAAFLTRYQELLAV
uniref:Uncharacterized protein n=1 Tax=Hyaloperonospora arabidopsidis (strain Emoy2) TaxID=559515 RepID=M4BVJ7_HYAAE